VTSDHERRLVHATRAHAGAGLAFGGAAIGVVALIGWMSGTPWLTTILPGLPPMMPTTALTLLLMGGAAALRQPHDDRSPRRWVSTVAALLVLAITVGTLAEYLFPINLPILRITHLLVRQPPAVSPTNMSLIAAVSLTFLALAMLLLNVRATARVRPSELLALCTALTAFAGLTGIVLGAASLFLSPGALVIGLSLPTAASLLLISTGLLLGPARGGATRLATSTGPGGSLIRRLAIPVALVPILLGLGVSRGVGAENLVGVAAPLAILSASTTAVSLLLLLVTAASLNRANEDVQASRTRISQLVEHASDGIFVADLSGRYTDVNDAGCRLLGYSREEIIGKTIVDLIPPSDVERLWQTREELLKGGIQVAEWALRRKDGSYVPVEVSAKILSDGRWQGFARDISERKRLQREAEQASEQLVESERRSRLAYREAQRATQVRDEVLGIVAHDLRNPLLVIMMEARFLAGHGRELDSTQPAQQIERAVNRMNRLIDDLLDVTRIEAGRLTVERSRISAAQIAQHAGETQRALAASKSLEIRLDVPGNLCEILGDRDRLLQVFENLIGNAIRFAPTGGTITVGAFRQDAAVRFWVSDTGPGIAIEDQPQLFDRFWQARTAKRGGGAGLGLPIVRGIVEAHGGRVWVESAPGSGSTFFFEIPVA
jgi:PAS domain S-box-containing protein